MIIFLWLLLLTVFAGSYIVYFAYLKFNAGKPWKIKKDPTFCPAITVLIPAHNEERLIQKKLENLMGISYPKEKMEIIVLDDGSTDETVVNAYAFVREHPEFLVKILKYSERAGKAHVLNKGLAASSNEIVVVTDADSFWPKDILVNALPYMADQTVGAITGFGVAMNPSVSWVTEAEKGYLDLMHILRLGESKVHSTIRFEGSFCVFRRSAFDKFDDESGADDSGTALKVVQNNFRAILVPEAYAFSEFPSKFWVRTKVKVRRAVHLTGLWVQCFRLLLGRRLKLPKRIAVPEIVISLFNPIVFVAFAFVTFVLVAYYPIVLIPIVLVLCTGGLIPKIRTYLVQGVIDQLILFYSMILHVAKRRIVFWDKS